MKENKLTEKEISELYNSYNNTLKLLSNAARSGCEVSALNVIKVMTQQELIIKEFGWYSMQEDGKRATFAKLADRPPGVYGLEKAKVDIQKIYDDIGIEDPPPIDLSME